mmetsp:Transcript_28900/g.48517  ORF Transcript_28900/g.48517 Transcript_28900/m.48517 type:complete len:216 (+) Transcript_28900:656-1303(+)
MQTSITLQLNTNHPLNIFCPPQSVVWLKVPGRAMRIWMILVAVIACAVVVVGVVIIIVTATSRSSSRSGGVLCVHIRQQHIVFSRIDVNHILRIANAVIDLANQSVERGGRIIRQQYIPKFRQTFLLHFEHSKAASIASCSHPTTIATAETSTTTAATTIGITLSAGGGGGSVRTLLILLPPPRGGCTALLPRVQQGDEQGVLVQPVHHLCVEGK